MTATSQWINRTYQSDDVDPVLRLLQECMGPESHGAQRPVWLWKHLASPFGPSYVRLAQDDNGTLMGMRAFMRWEFRAGDRTIQAVRAVDTATHSNYRRMGIFSTLTRSVLADVEREGTHVVFNTPNDYSMPGYLKLGWQQISVVHPLIKVLNYPAFALGLARHKLGKSWARRRSSNDFFGDSPRSAVDLLQNGGEIQELLGKEHGWRDREACISTRRTVEYLRWRYGQHPNIPYWTVEVRDGGLQGLGIFRTNVRYGLKEVVLSELVLAQPHEGLARQILDSLRASLRADYLICYFPTGSFHRRAVESWGFRTVPREGMNFTVRPLAADLLPNPQSWDNWWLAMGDLELF